MTTHSKRVAAAALSVALGFGGAAAIAGTAFADTPTATPTATKSAVNSPKATNTPQVVPTEFRNSAGTDGTQPQYESLSSSDTTLTSFGSLYTQAGKPLAGQVVAVYEYTNGVRGAQLGAGTTNAQGQFRFDAKLPSGWSSKAGFNVQLAFDDPNGASDGVLYGSASGVLKPIASTATPTKSATATKSPTKKPTTTKKPTAPPTKDTTGGLAKTGN
ncbi:hypothetical protein [Enemella evansiae]|uniref:hypothetical protein n=1 Tax=Enemella evansiae TaxID=2016499 RepID=UPI000B977853|nr:hypothetical protein [Enemella evansiae]OYN96974.1 hypothetical protein CGZ96_11890 [Enemella evansiae]OYO06184.1 hypothetical protein CGZ97_05950 [Enemella evansiae]OYO11872.1 hypothetical protein CGZ98_06630 [Enemella evansiae]PFG68914.1 hypothetical protein B0O41_3762 [Propionibacteriaceae bacterium ES.041]